ncbi:MAG TPA: DUF3343 domain-containing protein [Thermoguttaceae bacterium]
MNDPTRWLILFDSIHHVLAAERFFHEQGLWCDLVPIPKDISPDCGMALEFHAADRGSVGDLLTDPRVGKHRVIQYP